MLRTSLLLLFLFSALFSQSQQTIFKRIDLNDEVRIEANVLKENERIPHGKYRQLYLAKKHVDGNYDNGKKQGEWKRYYLDGSVMISGKYINGVPSGEWIRYDALGNKVARFKYENGKPSGHWTSTLANGGKGLDFVFDENFLIQGVLYYPDGKPAILTECSIKNSDTLEYLSLYYPNYRIHKYNEFKNGFKHGSQILYHANGARQEEFEFVEGRIREVESLRSINGQPLQKGGLLNGTGELRGYYANGMLFYKKYFKNGQLNGKVEYFSGGKPIYSGQFENGKPTGIHQLSDADYSVEVSIDYSKAIPLVTRFISTASNEVDAGSVVNGLREGRWFRTNMYSDTIRYQHFENGLTHGAYKEFTSSGGHLRLTGQYECGTRTGVWQTFNPSGKVTYSDSLNNEPTCNFNPLEMPAKGFIPIEVNNGFWFTSEDPLTQSYFSKNLAHYIPALPGADLLEASLTYQAQIIEDFLPQRDDLPKYAPFFIPAKYPGEEGAEYRFFETHPVFVEKAKELNVRGSILLRFKVDELGMISDVNLLRGIHPELDAGAVEFVKQLTAWEPALYNGLPIATYVLKRMDVYFE